MGLTEYFAGAVGVMGYQKSIREYCPNDSTEARFANLHSTQKWLKKNGGRAVFLLLSGNGNSAQLEGYGWTGPNVCPRLPDHPLTAAFRIGERMQGKGLAKDFIQIILSTTGSIIAPGLGIGLETWQSNPASAIYPKVGFELITHAINEELRPTLNYSGLDALVRDRRLYMGLPPHTDL